MKPGYARIIRTAVVTFALAGLWSSNANAQAAREQYEAALAREPEVRNAIEHLGSDTTAPIRTQATRQATSLIATYASIARRHRRTGYADNALFNAASLADALYTKLGRPADRATALRLYRQLAAEYPTSSLVKQTPPRIAALESADSGPIAPTPTPPVTSEASPPTARRRESAGRATLTAIEREVLPQAVRVTLQLDREVPYREEKLSGPSRVFFDLKGVRAMPELADAVLRYPSEAVRQIRVGRHPENTVRVVLDLEGVDKYSVFTLYNPFRLVIDCERVTTTAKATPRAPIIAPAAPAPAPAPALRPPIPTPSPLPPVAISERPVVMTKTEPEPEPSKPVLPSSPNTAGGFSLARQLGLTVSRIVIDPGHGGHDPGAQARGLTEAELTLDIALRLEALLQEDAGIEVILTRRTNVYIPLEERTAIANRENADLFLSIHANASRRAEAGGVETYFLSFASSPDAEAVAARENATSAGEMSKLPDLIRKIALNNKLDESKDLAGMVQEALVTRLRRSNRNLRNLGVKKAPFVVLIGAGMPSVLAEVSFLTNKHEAQLLKSATYKQRIAEALHAAVMRYRRSLKGAAAVTELRAK